MGSFQYALHVDLLTLWAYMRFGAIWILDFAAQPSLALLRDACWGVLGIVLIWSLIRWK